MLNLSDHHKFNDDLLLELPDRELAARRYPTIFHVLDNPEQRRYFKEFDVAANHAKRRSRTAGFWTIFLGCAALISAAAEPLVHSSACTLPSVVVNYLPPGIVDLISAVPGSISLAAFSGLAGILCFVIGGTGVMFAHSKRKRQWLFQRLMTERIRQFHFQTLFFRIPDIVASLRDDLARDKFRTQRDGWLESFKQRMDGKLDAELAQIIRNDNGKDIWLHEDCSEQTETKESEEIEPLFRAYRELRIMHQIGYANYQLRDDNRLFSTAPRRQAAVLLNVSFICIVLLVAVHVLVLIGAVTHLVGFQPQMSVIVIIIALVALGVRAIEQGLQPEREIERYQQYLAVVRAIRERYDSAPSQADKIRIMQEMERVSFDEMRNFLITNDRARFIM